MGNECGDHHNHHHYYDKSWGQEIITSSSRSCDESSCIKIIIKYMNVRTELGEGFLDFGFWRDWGLD